MGLQAVYSISYMYLSCVAMIVSIVVSLVASAIPCKCEYYCVPMRRQLHRWGLFSLNVSFLPNHNDGEMTKWYPRFDSMVIALYQTSPCFNCMSMCPYLSYMPMGLCVISCVSKNCRFEPHWRRGLFLVWAFSKPLTPNC